MRKTILALLTGTLLLVGVSPVSAEPDIIKWLKDPCVPSGDLENDCHFP